MSVSTTQQLLRIVRHAAEATNTDLTLRQLTTLLMVGAAGSEGIDATTIERRTESSQAATSRNLKKLSVEYQLVKAILDPADGRRRVFIMAPKGNALLPKMQRCIDEYIS